MIAGLNPYSAYKDSGLAWLGKVPAHWEVGPLRHHIACLDGKRVPLEASVRGKMLGDYPYWGANRIIDRLNDYLFDEDLILLGEDGASFFEPNRPVAFFSRGKVWPNNHIHVLRLIGGSRPEFIVHALNCTEYENYVSGATRDKLTQSRMKAIPIPIPPLPEQTAIVRFLDHADRRIRRYIRAKQKLIALLEEQKQAIIHQAVTGQTDVRTGQPYPAYKPSGVEWIGDVPAHWQVAALRHRYSQCLGKMLDSKRITGNHSLPYLRNVDVQWDQINTDDLPTMDIPPDEYDRYTLRKGDLLVCEGGEVGRCALWSGGLLRCGFQKALHRLRPLNAGQDVPRFMHYALRVAVKGNAFNDGHLSTIPHLTGDKLRAHRFAFPPALEQESLVTFLDAMLKRVDQTISQVGRQIDLVQEYRTRLIADAVTGKFDVLDVVAGLSEVDI